MNKLTNPRIQIIDILRGFALCGIFFVNTPAFFMPTPYYAFNYNGMDEWIRFFYDAFIQTKFYTIFSFLFGVSAFYFMAGIENKGLNPRYYFSKRLFWLFIFGALHFNLLWFGDILHTYALIGFFLLLFYKRKVITQLVWAGGLYIFYFLYELSNHLNNAIYTTESPYFTAFINEQGQVNFYTNLLGQIQERWGFFKVAIPAEIMVFPFEFLPIFLIGMSLAQIGFFKHPENFMKQIKIGQYLSLFLYLPLFYLMFKEFGQGESVSQFYIYLSGKVLAIFYITTLVRLSTHTSWKKRLTILAPLGKTAFTNYIAHTVLSLCIVSLFVKDISSIPLWVQTLYVLIVLTLQVFLSKWIVNKWGYGPLEYIWRTLTYGKMSNLKKRIEKDFT